MSPSAVIHGVDSTKSPVAIRVDSDGKLELSPSSSFYAEVANYAALPAAGDHTGEIQIVLASQGSKILFTFKDAGMYYSNGVTWTRLGDTPSYFLDSEFRVFNNSDTTKKISFDVSPVTTGTTRTITAQDKDGIIAYLSDISASTTTLYTETLTSGNWVLDADTIYYQDVTHNLGSMNTIKSFRDTSDNTDFIVHSAVSTDSNTVRVKISGNADNVAVIIATGELGEITTITNPFVSLSTDTTLNTTTQQHIKVDTSGGDVTLTLPSSATATFAYEVHKVSSDTNNVIMARTGADTIVGDTTFSFYGQYDQYTFVPDGGTLYLVR